MPRSSTTPRRCARRDRSRLASVVRIACCALLFAACDGSGGGAVGGAPPATSSTSTPAATTTSVGLAWGDAEGPVAGYSVYVQRNGGAFQRETDVPQASVTLSGTPGETARVIVAAFDAAGNFGPGSPPSPVLTFPAVAAQSSASAASAAPAAAPPATATTSVLAASDPREGGVASDPESSAAALTGGALVWQAGDALRVTNASLETTLLFSRPAPGAVLEAVADFDGDGQGDLLWVGTDGAVAYTPAASLRSASSGTPVVDLGTLQAGERVLGAGDFDGDGRGDLLVGRAGDTIDIWFTAPGAALEIVEQGIAAQAVLAGVGDFDGNGSEDIAWRASEGALVLWLMDGARADASIEVALASDLEVTATGDFDGNGTAELAVRDPNGDVFVVRPLAVPLVLEATDFASAQTWQAAGAVDLDRDGTDEIVFAGVAAIRIAGLPGDEVLPLDPESPWQLVALLP